MQAQNYANPLKMLRTASNLTLQQAADACQIAKSTLAGWEQKGHFKDVNQFMNLLEIYGLTADEQNAVLAYLVGKVTVKVEKEIGDLYVRLQQQRGMESFLGSF